MEEDDQQFHVGCQLLVCTKMFCHEHKRSVKQDVDLWYVCHSRGTRLCKIIHYTVCKIRAKSMLVVHPLGRIICCSQICTIQIKYAMYNITVKVKKIKSKNGGVLSLL